MWRTKVLLGLAKVLCINYAVTEWVVTGSTIAVDCTDTAVWPHLARPVVPFRVAGHPVS
jgi:hypothetical protein